MEFDWAVQRRTMVDRQLRTRGIRDDRVLSAMLKIPREQFIPESERARAYFDEPVPIGHGQTISQPFMVALMAQSLALTGREKVLEIGTGCGYHAAVLGMLAGRVIGLELLPELAEMARRNLERIGRSFNVEVLCRDGSGGYPEEAPFDAISVAAGTPQVPPPLLEQLAEGGRLVIPVGDYDEQELVLHTRQGGETRSRFLVACRFVPLRGGKGWS